jgi:hypothetical protein
VQLDLQYLRLYSMSWLRTNLLMLASLSTLLAATRPVPHSSRDIDPLSGPALHLCFRVSTANLAWVENALLTICIGDGE